jgi:hypothetical protein
MIRPARFVPAVLALAAFFSFFGCAPKTDAPGAAAEGDAVETAEALPQGVILTEASLLELKEDGKVHWKSNLNAADTVIWKDEKRDLVRAYDGQSRTFYRVDLDGDYWVQDYAVAGPAEAAVIVAADTVLYSRPDLTSPLRSGTVSLPRYSIAALLPDDNIADSFVKITARLEGAANPQISERHVKIDAISTDPNDVGAVKLARIASGTENPVVRKELLKNAMEMAGRGRYLSRSVEESGGDPVLFELILTDNIERFDALVHYFVTAGTVNLRDMPSTVGQSLETLEQGDSFSVTGRTKREVTLKAAEGETPPKGVWLWVDSGGWIFSAYAAPNPAY